MEKDITKKINKVAIVTKTFTPEGGQPTDYKRLVLSIVYAGNVKEIEIKATRDQILVLETLPESDEATFLKQNSEPSTPQQINVG